MQFAVIMTGFAKRSKVITRLSERAGWTEV
jgi:hypothetical protein